MLILLAALVLPVPAAIAAAPPPRACAVRSSVVPAGGEGGALRRLDRLPTADAYLTVFREVDHCPDPLIVRTRIGSGARP